MESNKRFKCCYVPECMNTNTNSPDKIFVALPQDEEKKRQWLLAANISKEELFDLPRYLYFCEDHFQESDFHNYFQYKAKMSAILLITQDAFPTNFSCQKSKTEVARQDLTSTTVNTVKTPNPPENVQTTAPKENEVSKCINTASPAELKQIEQHLQIYDNIVSKLFDKSDASYPDHIYFLQEFIVHVPIICTSITEMFVSKTFNLDQWYNFETANFMACASLSGKKLPAFLHKEPVVHGRLNRPDGEMKSCVLMAWLRQHFAKFKAKGNVLLVLNSNARTLLRNPPPELSNLIKKLHISLYVTPQIGTLELNPIGLEVFNCFQKALEAIVSNHCMSASRLIAASETLLSKFATIAWSKVGPEALSMSFQKSGICSAGSNVQLHNVHQTERVATATMTSGASVETQKIEGTIKMEEEEEEDSGTPAPDMRVSGSQSIATSVLRVVPGKSDDFEMVFLPKHPENEDSEERNIFECCVEIKEEPEPFITQDDVISESETMLFPTLTPGLNVANSSQHEAFQAMDLHPIAFVSSPLQSSSITSVSNTQNLNSRNINAQRAIFPKMVSHSNTASQPITTASAPLPSSTSVSNIQNLNLRNVIASKIQNLNLGNIIAQPVTVQNIVSHPTVSMQSTTSTSNLQLASSGISKPVIHKPVQQIILKPTAGLTTKTIQQLRMTPVVELKKLPTTIQESGTQPSIICQAPTSLTNVRNTVESHALQASNINANRLLVPSTGNIASRHPIPTISQINIMQKTIQATPSQGMTNISSHLQPVPPLSLISQNTNVTDGGNNIVLTTVRTLQKIPTKTLPRILNKSRSFPPQSQIFDATSLDSNSSNNISFSWVSVCSVNESNSTEASYTQQISNAKQARKQDPSRRATKHWFERFKPLSQAIHKTLTISCLLCDEVCSCPEALRLHLNTYHPQELYRCNHCLRKYDAKQIILHILSEHKCRYCGVEATHVSALTNHLKDVHNSYDQPTLYMSFGGIYHCSPVVIPNKLKHLQARYQCDGCGYLMKNVANCKIHQQRGCILVSCDWCRKEYFTTPILIKHMLQAHLKRYYCTFKKCKRSYAFRQSLKLHQDLYHSFPLDIRRKKGAKRKNRKPKLPKVSESGRPLRRVAAHNLEIAKAIRSVKESITLRCDHCGLKKHSRAAMKLHLWTRHLSHVSLQCLHCGKLSISWKMHRIHLKNSVICSIWV